MLIDRSRVPASESGKYTYVESGGSYVIDHTNGSIYDENRNTIGVVVRQGNEWEIIISPTERTVITYEERWKDVPASPSIEELLWELKKNNKKK